MRELIRGYTESTTGKKYMHVFLYMFTLKCKSLKVKVFLLKTQEFEHIIYLKSRLFTPIISI